MTLNLNLFHRRLVTKQMVLPLALSFGLSFAHAQTPGKIVAYTQSETTTETIHRGDITPFSADYTQGNILAGIDGAVNCITLLSSNRMYVGGTFNTANGIPVPRFTRLLSNGAWDSSFNVSGNILGAGIGGTSVDAMTLQADGKVLVGGQFTSYNGTTVRNLIRVNSSGVLDADNVFDNDARGRVLAIAMGTGETIYLGGSFSTLDTNQVSDGYPNIVRLTSTGLLDPAFLGTTRADKTVRTIVVQPDNKILIGGDFDAYDGVTRKKIARLNADGTLDTTFDPGTTFTDSVHCMLLQTDGKVLVGGKLQTGSGDAPRCVRLTATGGVDATFNSPSTGGAVNAMTVQQISGRLIVAGTFTTPRVRVMPLSPTTGAIEPEPNDPNQPSDYSKIGNTGPNGAVNAVASYFGVTATNPTEGYLVVGGTFTGYVGSPRVTSLFRVNPKGIRDQNGILTDEQEGSVDEKYFNRQIIQQAQMSSNQVSTFSYKPGLKRYWLFDVENRRYARISHYSFIKVFQVELFENLPLTMMAIAPGTSRQWIIQHGEADFLRTGPTQADRGQNKGTDEGIPAPVLDAKDTWGIRSGTFQMTGRATLQPIVKVPLTAADRATIPGTLTYYGMEVDNILRKRYVRITTRSGDVVDSQPLIPGNQPFNGYDFTEYLSRPVSGILKFDKLTTYDANELPIDNNTIRTLENAIGHVKAKLIAAGYTQGTLR